MPSMTPSDVHFLLISEYGIDATVGGVSALGRAMRGSGRIRSRRAYVAACRRLVRGYGLHLVADPRLVGLGWCHYSPRVWVGEPAARGVLDDFLDYWNLAARRPDVVGSSHNPGYATTFRAWRGGLPASVARHLGDHADFLRSPDDGGRACPCTRCTATTPVTSARPSKWRDHHGEFCYARTRRLPRRQRQRLIRAARAAARTSMQWRDIREEERSSTGRTCDRWDYRHAFSLRALEALGRLSPELQRVAMQHVDFAATSTDLNPDAPHRRRVIRVRELPWAEIAKVRDQMRSDSTGRVRHAWNVGRRAAALAPGIPALTPTYPAISRALARRLVRGETPVELSGGILNRREAHAWLLGGAGQEPLVYLSSTLPAGTPPVRSAAVVRWLQAVKARGDWSSLTRMRTFPGPGGQATQARYLDRVDEIQDADLPRGPGTGVHAAFESAALRHGDAAMRDQEDDHRVLTGLPRGWRLFRNSMRLLCTPAQLVREGRDMSHCVGGYADIVREGRSVILAIRVRTRGDEHRSTVEIAPNGRVLQHRGPNNADPHPLCERVLEAFIRRSGIVAAARRHAA